MATSLVKTLNSHLLVKKKITPPSSLFFRLLKSGDFHQGMTPHRYMTPPHNSSDRLRTPAPSRLFSSKSNFPDKGEGVAVSCFRTTKYFLQDMFYPWTNPNNLCWTLNLCDRLRTTSKIPFLLTYRHTFFPYMNLGAMVLGVEPNRWIVTETASNLTISSDRKNLQEEVAIWVQEERGIIEYSKNIRYEVESDTFFTEEGARVLLAHSIGSDVDRYQYISPLFVKTYTTPENPPLVLVTPTTRLKFYGPYDQSGEDSPSVNLMIQIQGSSRCENDGRFFTVMIPLPGDVFKANSIQMGKIIGGQFKIYIPKVRTVRVPALTLVVVKTKFKDVKKS